MVWCSWHQPGKFRQTFCGFLAIFDFRMHENLRRVQKGKKICHILNQHIESNKLNPDSQTARVTDRFKCILKRGLIPTSPCHQHVLPPDCTVTSSPEQPTGTKRRAPSLNAQSSYCRQMTPGAVSITLSLLIIFTMLVLSAFTVEKQ